SNAVKVYKEAVNKYYSGNYEYDPAWMEEIQSTSNRSYTQGFYNGQPNEDANNYNDRNSYSQTHQLVAKIEEKIGDNEYILGIRNKVLAGETLEVITTSGKPRVIVMPKMTLLAKTGEELVEAANPNSIVRITLEGGFEAMDMIRRVK
ncbi:MAG: U32 family peptidase C-terminal domain-containing protein, partial [Cetobacterium sp.]